MDLVRSSFHRDLPKNACTGYVNGNLGFYNIILVVFFSFRNRFGNTINGFRRGALVSEKSSSGRMKIIIIKKKTNWTKIVIRIQTGGRWTNAKKKKTLYNWKFLPQYEEKIGATSFFFHLPVKLGEFNNITQHIPVHTVYTRRMGTFKHDMW